MTQDWLLIVLVAVAIIVHVLQWVARPRQIEDALRVALGPLSSQIAGLERRITQQESRTERGEAGNRALETEINRRLQDLIVHVTRMEGSMTTRADYDRLHALMGELGRDIRGSVAEMGSDVAEASSQSEQAIARVTRLEAHLMEKER